jgi:hypothetical protein
MMLRWFANLTDEHLAITGLWLYQLPIGFSVDSEIREMDLSPYEGGLENSVL